MKTSHSMESSSQVGSPPFSVGSPDTLQRRSNESEIDYLLRVTKTASQPGLIEELQKQHLPLNKLSRSDELSDFEVRRGRFWLMLFRMMMLARRQFLQLPLLCQLNP
jgi:hypothetical protein